MAGFLFQKMDFTEHGNLSRILVQTNYMFKTREWEFMRTREIAKEVSALIESVSPFIQSNTDAICPGCREVCCINRHSYHDHQDIVYLCALGEKMPSHRKDVDDSDPCQFLGEKGCIVKRSLRPYRCTWFFCTPLLENIRNGPSLHYRRFIGSLQLITQKRTDMLDEFIKVSREVLLSIGPVYPTATNRA